MRIAGATGVNGKCSILDTFKNTWGGGANHMTAHSDKGKDQGWNCDVQRMQFYTALSKTIHLTAL